MRKPTKPGIFWTWQDRQVEDAEHLRAAVRDMARNGFDKLLVQPRGCRYGVDDALFVKAVGRACEYAREEGAEIWLHLDPRSMARSVGERGGSADFVIVAGTSDDHRDAPLDRRPLDVETEVAPDGSFELRLDYPHSRPYHVHSDGAIRFRPRRLERVYAYRVNAEDEIVASTLRDVTESAHLFTNEIRGYVEVFGRLPLEETAAPEEGGLRPGSGDAPVQGGWRVLAAVSFASNYPDFANPATRMLLAEVLERYAEAGVALGGLWWDEPGYCTGFDRGFRADRGRLPWGAALTRSHYSRTGRSPLDDLPYLLRESDDGEWGWRRRQYYGTVQAAVFEAQAELSRQAREAFSRELPMGVHQTWHQNGDDVINGCADWWEGARLLGAGFSDVGDAHRIDDARQMAEVRTMTTIAVSLARNSGAQEAEAYCNLWGVEYGEGADGPRGEIVDWWVDLQAALGCNWLAHTYGPTGYFERPSVWGPGYPDHPTWSRMPSVTSRLSEALQPASGRLPRADVAFVYPLGTLYRLASDLANELSNGAHLLIDTLLRAGFELDVVSPEALRRAPDDRYRHVLYAHPFGASEEDVAELVRRRSLGASIIAHGLPPVPGRGYADSAAWQELGLELPEGRLSELRSAQRREPLEHGGRLWEYAPVTGWGSPQWGDAVVSSSEDGSQIQTPPAHYLGFLLEGLGSAAVDLLSALGVRPDWSIPEGSLASRTLLPDGGLVLRLAPTEFDRPFQGSLHSDRFHLEVGACRGLLGLRLDSGGTVVDAFAPEGVSWRLETVGGEP